VFEKVKIVRMMWKKNWKIGKFGEKVRKFRMDE
jgi:hypothetical protein